MTHMETTKIALFKGRDVRKVIHNKEWWFSVNDVIEVLTDSHDPAQYFKRLKERDEELAKLTDKGGGYNLYHPRVLSSVSIIDNSLRI